MKKQIQNKNIFDSPAFRHLWREIPDEREKYSGIYEEVYKNVKLFGDADADCLDVIITDDTGEILSEGKENSPVIQTYLKKLDEEYLKRKQEFDKKVPFAEKSSKKKKAKSFNKLDKSHPFQPELFTKINTNSPDYSQTIELYDFIPKYVWGSAKCRPDIKYKFCFRFHLKSQLNQCQKAIFQI